MGPYLLHLFLTPNQNKEIRRYMKKKSIINGFLKTRTEKGTNHKRLLILGNKLRVVGGEVDKGMG